MGAFHCKVSVTVQMGFLKGGRNWSWSLTRVVARRASTVFDCSAKSNLLVI